MLYYKFLNPEPIYYFCEIDYVFKTEQFKDVIGYEGMYQVSDLGRVKSLSRKKRKNENAKFFITKEFILKSLNTKLGYQLIVLYKNSIRESFPVHRLVALAFIPNPDNKPEVNHENEIKNDNKALNLSWMTKVENMRHSLSVKVFQYDSRFNLVKVWNNLTDTKKHGFNPCNVVDTCRGRQKHHRGFIWSYNEIKSEVEKNKKYL